MSTAVISLDLDRLQKLCGMFGSAHDGEIANAARMADRLVRGAGLTWGDILTVPTALPAPMHVDPVEWRDVLAFCERRYERLTQRQKDFIDNLGKWRGEPTEKQLSWLMAIFERLCDG